MVGFAQQWAIFGYEQDDGKEKWRSCLDIKSRCEWESQTGSCSITARVCLENKIQTPMGMIWLRSWWRNK